jgi:hypothetical protein
MLLVNQLPAVSSSHVYKGSNMVDDNTSAVIISLAYPKARVHEIYARQCMMLSWCFQSSVPLFR